MNDVHHDPLFKLTIIKVQPWLNYTCQSCGIEPWCGFLTHLKLPWTHSSIGSRTKSNNLSNVIVKIVSQHFHHDKRKSFHGAIEPYTLVTRITVERMWGFNERIECNWHLKRQRFPPHALLRVVETWPESHQVTKMETNFKILVES